MMRKGVNLGGKGSVDLDLDIYSKGNENLEFFSEIYHLSFNVDVNPPSDAKAVT